jgi:uncharacterized membrane-anchored protein
MKLTSLRRGRSQSLPGITGVARLDRRTRAVVKRARRGDIVIIDHVDIDRGAAVSLVDAGVSVVVNLAPSISGRYPNLGPGVLLEAGIVLIDNADSDAFSAISEGDVIRIDGDSLYKGEILVSSGVRQTRESVDASLEASRDGMASQLEAFSANAVEHLRREQGLLLDGEGVPAVATRFEGRPVLVVARAFDYQRDLASLKTYIRENSPVLVGVEAGADALLEAGHVPDLIVSELEDVSELALRCGAEIVGKATSDGQIVGKATSDGQIRGLERVERLGLTYGTFATAGSPEDAAILLAHQQGATLIVLVGSHASLVEFIDRGRSGMASSFLTRAAVGATVVDAKAVAELYRNRVRGWLVLVLVVLALGAVAAAIATTPVGQDWWHQLRSFLDDAYTWSRERVT